MLEKSRRKRGTRKINAGEAPKGPNKIGLTGEGIGRAHRVVGGLGRVGFWALAMVRGRLRSFLASKSRRPRLPSLSHTPADGRRVKVGGGGGGPKRLRSNSNSGAAPLLLTASWARQSDRCQQTGEMGYYKRILVKGLWGGRREERGGEGRRREGRGGERLE